MLKLREINVTWLIVGMSIVRVDDANIWQRAEF